jgi:histidyl-tRNA synthetase
MPKFQAIRGTKDILPAEAAAFQQIESRSRALLARFGYQEIRTPTFEGVELFHRSLGETTDVVQKEMYVFEDRGGRKIALRPEGTAGVVRAFVEHHLSQSAPFCKLFYIGPMFRAERPQAGRFREFWQIGAEYFGNASPAADAELLLLVQSLFCEFGLKDAQLKINSLGDSECRPKYLEALTTNIESLAGDLCQDCQKRAGKNPLRVLDCKVDGPHLSKIPTIDQFWCGDCRSHFEQVQVLLRLAGGTFDVAPRLVRGLDYYTRTVFEVTSKALGAQDALAAGGRYDTLVKDLDGPSIPALGFALGVERALQAMGSSKEAAPSSPEPLRLFVAALGEEAGTLAFVLLQDLRRNADLAKAGISVDGGFFDKKLGAQMGIADRLGSSHCIIMGDDEIKSRELTLRTMRSGHQERLPFAQLPPHLLSLARA